jgi:ElaB/YqjD/DUF883 family membrane-anchored ribosome-binding protein
MSDTPSASSTTPTGSGSGSGSGSGAGEGISSGAAREPRGFSASAGQDRRQATIDQASSALAAGVDTATARMQDVQRWADEQHQTARVQIREHPMAAVAVTFGAGMLLGMLLGRR